MESLLDLLDDTEAVPLVISGSSMTPFLVHRRDAGSYTMAGDAQTHPEPGIINNQIRAAVTAVRRKDKLLVGFL